MKRITKNLLTYWKYLGGIFLLFLVQIYSITGVTNSVYGMRSIGSQKSGIEYMISEALTAEAWKTVELYMSDSEKIEWSNSYEKAADGYYYLNESMMDADQLSDLEKKFMIPQAIVWKLSQTDDEEVNSLLGDEDSPFAAEYMEIRDILEEQLESEGEQEIRNCALNFVREQSEIAGVDLKEKTTQYIWGAVFRMIVFLVLFAGSVAGSFYLIGILEHEAGRRFQEPEVRQAEQLFSFVICMIVYAVFLYGNSFCELGQKGAGAAWYLAGVLGLLAGLFGVWLLRTRSGLEKVYQRVAWTERNRRRYINRMQLAIGAGIPGAALLAGATAVVLPAIAYVMWLLLADAALTVGVFLLPEIAAAADCVEETFENVDIDN